MKISFVPLFYFYKCSRHTADEPSLPQKADARSIKRKSRKAVKTCDEGENSC